MRSNPIGYIAVAALSAALVVEVRRCRRAEASAVRQRRLAELRSTDLRPLVSAVDATLVAIEDALPGLDDPGLRLAGRSDCVRLRAVR